MAVDERSELEEALSRWQLDAAAVRERMYRAPTPRERERWHALWLALQGWSTARVATALGRAPHGRGQAAPPHGGAKPGRCPRRGNRCHHHYPRCPTDGLAA